ncbi:cadherin-86C [Diorhabda carinulata]|uniref:cadherin-86C n=1 Tax=Diorhabda carinulata TaxID=1163345 RepID=UPI00259FFBCF|nr:cadherin-86C [Diorhabda carinulata]
MLLKESRETNRIKYFAMRCWLFLMCGPLLVNGVPRFDPSAQFRDILVPADAAVGAVFYRLRASDLTFDYPLVFSLQGQSNNVEIQSLNCSRFNSVCQANVILKKRLEVGRIYDFTVEARSQRGESAFLNCSFRATNATTPLEKIFPGALSLLSISESARRNTELGTIRAIGNSLLPRAVLLELWGSPEFSLHQKLLNDRDAEGTILLLNSLDYEKKTVHHLTMLANDPWTNTGEDSRNIAGWPILVAVLDEQDTPPVFTLAPPTTTLSPNLQPGDLVLRVHAEDGDRGNPRDIRYGLVPEDDPFVTFFSINETTGEIRLIRPISEIISFSHGGQPLLMSVIAEEVRSNPEEAPAQSTTVQLAIIPPGTEAGKPSFGAFEYNALLDENSPLGTVLDLPQAEINIQPGDVVTLDLLNNNGTFDIFPKVIDANSKFEITIRNPEYLDYEERQSVECYIIAKEVGAGNYTTKAKLTVILNDVNDNPPKFTEDKYYATVQEHVRIDTQILVVEADDIDKKSRSEIRYINLTGEGSELFRLDRDTGLITVADSINLDAEIRPVINLQVEAADENGEGLKTLSNIEIKLTDINDNPPIFVKEIYEFILNSDRTGFTTRAIIKASDNDITSPNNEIHYEIINLPENLYVDEKSGEILVTKSYDIEDVVLLKARAWDGGVPRLYSESEVRIYPPEGHSRKMVFIIPGANPDKTIVADTLKALTGGKVSIDRIRPYTGDEPGATYVANDDDRERSVVEATVTFSKGSVIDLNEINRIINERIEERRVKEKEIIRIRESNAGNLTWLLILFLVLLLIAIVIMIICCVCRQCPLYNYAFHKRKIVTPVVEKIERVHVIGTGDGRDNKSVQVAEWFGRREAWTPEQLDVEAESLRKHEVDRGSDRGGMKKTIRQTDIQQEPSRDPFYIREGNADILRLITRGGEPQHAVNLTNGQQYMPVDSGKDILMRRFIEQQQRSQVILPNAVRAQSEQELLEASLRQQNALLRQILLDRERDLRLETQSLPAGTQTDHDAGTQTEPELMRPPKREIRSDNDQSDYSDEEDELAIIKAKAKRRNGRKINVRRKIKTPIQEEVESEIEHPLRQTDLYREELPHRQTNIYRENDSHRESELYRETEFHRQSVDNGDGDRHRQTESYRGTGSHRQRDSYVEGNHHGHTESRRESDSHRQKDFHIEGDPRRQTESYRGGDSHRQRDSYREDDSHRQMELYGGSVRRKKSSKSSGTHSSKSELKKEILEELLASLEQSYDDSDSGERYYKGKEESRYKKKRLFSDDSLEVSPKSDEKTSTDSNNHKYHSESDLRLFSSKNRRKSSGSSNTTAQLKSKSQFDLSEVVGEKKVKKSSKRATGGARYMDWYKKPQNTDNSNKETQKTNKKQKSSSKKPAKGTKPSVSSRLLLDTESSRNKKIDNKKEAAGPDHPLLQHSEYRYEAPYTKKPEEDNDSGIALTKPPITQKKSVFTIAYDDVHTNQLRADSTTSP